MNIFKKIKLSFLPKSNTKCDECGRALAVGERFYAIFHKFYCEFCQEKMGVNLTP